MTLIFHKVEFSDVFEVRWSQTFNIVKIGKYSRQEGNILAGSSVAKRALIATGVEVTEDDAGSRS